MKKNTQNKPYIIILFVFFACGQIPDKAESVIKSTHLNWRVDSFQLIDKRMVKIRFPLDSGYYQIASSRAIWDSEYHLDLSDGVDSLHFFGYDITGRSMPDIRDSTERREGIYARARDVGYSVNNVKFFTRKSNNHLTHDQLENTRTKLFHTFHDGKNVAFSISLETRDASPQKRLFFEDLCDNFTFEMVQK